MLKSNWVVRLAGFVFSTLSLSVSSAVPFLPTNVSSLMDNQGRITLLWQDNANNEEGYRIERRSDKTWAVVESFVKRQEYYL